MNKVIIRNLGKALLLRIPQIRRLYDHALELKAENESLKDLCHRNACLVDGVDVSGDPFTVLTSGFPDKEDEQYVELERRILLVLGSKQISRQPVERQVRWVKQIFSQCVSRLHPKSGLFAEMIDELLPAIFRDKSLSLSDACSVYDAMYGLYWCGAQSLMDMRGFDKHAVGLFGEYLAHRYGNTSSIPNKKVQVDREIRIAYFCHYAYETKGNALAPVVSALAKGHAKHANRKIYIYCVQWSSQDFIAEFDNSDVIVRNFANQAEYGQLDALANAILADEIDVAITEVASSIASYLFAKRVAPLQIWLEPGYPFWSNPNVDWVMVPGKVWQPWFGIPLSRHSNLRLGLPLANGIKAPSVDDMLLAKAKLPAVGKVFAVFTRLIKVTPAYLHAVKRILVQVPDAHMLFVGSGDARLIKSFMQDVTFLGRVTLINDNVDLNVYGRLIDVFLDTYPFIGGLACRDVACHGKPVVSLLAGEWDILLRNERLPALLSNNIDEYVEIAVRLAVDVDFYRDIVSQSQLLSDNIISDADMIVDVEFAINSAISNK